LYCIVDSREEAMNEIIEKLLEIQELDGKIRELTIERDKRPEALAREKASVEEGRTRVEEQEARRREGQVTIEGLNKVLMGREEQIRKLELSLLAPKISNKEYKAIQTQIASVKADNALTEEEILEAMEDLDRLSEKVEEATRELAGHEAALEEAGERVTNEVGLFDRQIEEIREQRRAKAAEVPGEVMGVFDRVSRARGASAVAPVIDGHCQGCYMTVTTQDVAQILRGHKLQQCKTCQRILYVPNPQDWITDA
jgi:predicted  nucleic acid-binding Zn-ribbon protein